jgi:flagellar protein FliS
VLAIIGELQNTLNVQQGGPVAAELDRLYSYVTARLVEVSAKNEGAPLDEVCQLLTTLREGWSSVASGTTAR